MRLAIPFMVGLALAVGCNARHAPSPANKAAPANDLRTLTMAELENFLRAKYHDDNLKLTGGANGHYKGTRPSPDGTVMLPLEVTVEADRVVCEVKTPAGTLRDTVPLEGAIQSELKVK